jgi:signal transduction histidine kinase
MSSFYVIDLGWGIQVGGGNIVYSAVIWCVMLFYITERDPDLTKMVIYSLVAIQALFLVLYPLILAVLSSSVTINPLMIPSAIFETSFWIFVVGNVLALIELMAMIFLLEGASRKWPTFPPSLLVISIYVLTLLVDGVLFPLFAFPVTQSISVVQGFASVVNKLLLGVFFSMMMLVAIVILKPKFTEGPDGVTLPFSKLFTLPKRDVVLALRTAEENKAMLRLLLDLLSHDIINYDQSLLTYLDLIQTRNQRLDQATSDLLTDAQQVVWESTDLVNNMLSLNKVQDEPIRAEPVSLVDAFDRALERTKRTFATLTVSVENREALQGVTVNVHPLLAAVLYNVLSNAVKYRQEGKTKVVIDLSLKEEERSVVLGVGDRGSGIPDEKKASLFDGLKTREQKGLGLAIVRAILTRFHSEIWVENRPESPTDYTQGSVFYLRLPKGKA